ncbi:putative ribonuclease H-like domain-containing protein [Tanacetum coccineum]
MQEELLQFELQKVWILVDLPNGKRAIRTKWVFKNKKDERGIVVRNNVRLVAQGYTQEEGIDYDEVFAPVARIEAIRLFFAYASNMGFIVYQMDIKSAFLYGTIEEEVYVCQPPGFEDPHFPDKVYNVEKALYGLHQAPRAWYETLSTYLFENGFRRRTIDKTLFIKKDKSDILLVQVYVDDIIFGSTKKTVCIEFEQMMHKRFQMSSIRDLTFFLAITPMEPNKALVKDKEDDNVDVHLYTLMIGSLMYLTASRPDIMFVVCACARFQVTPKVSHLHEVKRIFRYLKGNPQQEVLWIKNQMLDYGFNFMNTKIYIDNESTICIVKNPVFHSKTKHIEISRLCLTRDGTAADYEIQTAIVRIVDNGEQEITTTADGKEFTITEASVRRHLQLADVDGMLAIQAEEGEDKAVYKEWDDIVERATTTAASLDAAQASGNITKTQSTEIPNVPLPQGISAVVVLSLEEVLKQTKQVYGAAYTKLITKVKKLEKIVKTRQARRRAKIMVSDDKEELEDSSKQGRMIEEIDQDAGVTLVTPTHNAAKNVHTYTRRRRAVSTGSGGVSTASRLFSTAKESVSTTVSLHCRLVLWYVQELTKIKLDEEERQRIARVHEEASSFNIEEWEDIQATIEADEELAQRIQAKEREKYSKAEKARLLVELINHRKRYFAQQRAR